MKVLSPSRPASLLSCLTPTSVCPCKSCPVDLDSEALASVTCSSEQGCELLLLALMVVVVTEEHLHTHPGLLSNLYGPAGPRTLAQREPYALISFTVPWLLLAPGFSNHSYQDPESASSEFLCSQLAPFAGLCVKPSSHGHLWELFVPSLSHFPSFLAKLTFLALWPLTQLEHICVTPHSLQLDPLTQHSVSHLASECLRKRSDSGLTASVPVTFGKSHKLSMPQFL
jgi:hypothetical protein